MPKTANIDMTTKRVRLRRDGTTILVTSSTGGPVPPNGVKKDQFNLT